VLARRLQPGRERLGCKELDCEEQRIYRRELLTATVRRNRPHTLGLAF